MFLDHVMALDLPFHHYDPWEDRIQDVTLYHGLRASSWERFCQKGIAPPSRRNEFSVGPTFYVSNDLGHAFEHPLHNHPRLYAGDAVSVLAFMVPVDILHGDRAPPDGGASFVVRWFQFPDADWLSFCSGNLFEYDAPHDFDIVIGPSCIPQAQGQALAFQFHRCGETIQPTQIAFCSKRARTWLSSYAHCLLLEKRAS